MCRLFAGMCLGFGLCALLLTGALSFARQQPVTGAWLLFVNLEDDQIYRMWHTGAHLHRLTSSPLPKMQLSASPDGRWIAFTGNDVTANVYKVRHDGQQEQRLTLGLLNSTGAGAWTGQPAWSPDGEKIAYVSYQSGNAEIYLMDTDGTLIWRVTDFIDDDLQPAWSPDGRQLAFVSFRDGNGEVYTIAASGDNPRRLTAAFRYNGMPAWSPDGEWIAFTSNREGDYQLYKMRPDGSKVQRLTEPVLHVGYLEPRWSPDGQWIAFYAQLPQGYAIYTMRPDGSEMRAVTPVGRFVSPTWAKLVELRWRAGLAGGIGTAITLLGVFTAYLSLWRKISTAGLGL